VPKPLLRVAGKPLVEILIERLRACGVSRFFVTVRYKSEMIEKHFGDGARLGVQIRVRALTTQARRDPLEWVHEEVAFNYRLTNIQAALGAAQLEQLEAFLVRKRETAEHYRAGLGGLNGVCVAQEADWARSSYWMPAVLLEERRCRDVRGLIRRLDADGVQVRPVWHPPVWHPLHRQPPFQGARTGPISVADWLWDRGVLLPCSVGITADERQAVIEALTARLP
jgi:perosamine synthetase